MLTKGRDEKNMLCGLIMAGGKGTRFWPLSTEEKPKQFLNLVGNKTMIQMTVERIEPIIPIERIFVCTGRRYVHLVKEQLPSLPERNIIIEPEGRNTAPCIALSALVVQRYFINSKMVVLPSDHLIKEEEKFREIVLAGYKYVSKEKENIVTLGMTPNRVETGYGYIKYNSNNKKIVEMRELIEVEKFVEKPNEEKAKMYLDDGRYLWNGGMFIWDISHIINEIKKYIPNTYEMLKGIEEIEEKKLQQYINEVYIKTDAISVDYAILEKSSNIKVIPSDIGWDDIGTWKSIERYREKDENNNIFSAEFKAIESNSNMAINNKKIVMVGIKNTMAVETEDAIFIVNKNYMENLRQYKERI